MYIWGGRYSFLYQGVPPPFPPQSKLRHWVHRMQLKHTVLLRVLGWATHLSCLKA